MENAREFFGRVMYKTKLSKGAIVVLIAEMNDVTPKTVYQWLKSDDSLVAGRLNASLEDILKQYEEDVK